MTDSIGVLGCGWLGLPLGKKLLQNSHGIHGTTTSIQKLQTLQGEGICPYLISLAAEGIEGDIQGFLSNIDLLIVNVPPKMRSKNPESFLEKMKLLHAEIKKSKVQKVIFISSTSVYGDIPGEVTETSLPKPVTESAIQLLESENLFRLDNTLNTAVVRFGGLIGPTRHPVTILSGKKNLANGNDPVNLIHLDDCIHLISTIIENQYWDEIFNGVYPFHPKKSEYYSDEANKRDISPPHYTNEITQTLGKIVHSKNFLDKGHDFGTPINS